VSRRAGRSLDWFFEQWLLQPGFPKVQVTWGYDADESSVWLEVHQVQPQRWGFFAFLLPVTVVYADETVEHTSVRIDGGEPTHRLVTRADPIEILLDPEETLLLEVVELKRER